MDSSTPPPWAHQTLARERAQDLPWFALFMEMGTGKSRATIDILRDKINREKEFLRTLIFCPPLVIPNWRDEISKYSKIPPSHVHLLYGPQTKRLKEFIKLSSEPRIFVTNYESLLMFDLFSAFQRWMPQVLIFDESHRLKNMKAKRSKKAEELANPRSTKPYTYLLSGSPVLNSPLDLFFQYKIMDGGATFGSNFYAFQARYFRDHNAGMPSQRHFPDWRVKPGALGQINALLFRFGMRVEKKDCLDLPEEVAVTIKCGMSQAQTKNYAEMRRDFVTFTESHEARADMALVKALRLLQITSGFLPMQALSPEDDPTKLVYEYNPKEKALEELLEELTPNAKVIVWATWKENYATIRKVCERLKVEFVEVHGEISAAGQRAAVDRFRDDPLVRVFLGHPGSGGIGINLTCAPYSIFYSRTFSLEQWLQARARNHRGGQTEKVTHFDLVCEDTIDEIVCKKLASKLDMSDKLLRDLTSEIKAQTL